MKKLNIAIIGQGRSGRDIHGAYFKSENNKLFNVAVVVELDPERRQRALEEYPGCEVLENYSGLYGRKDIDVVLNSTYSNDHYKITKDLLENGCSVIVEKPFARTLYECEELINLANEKNVLLAVFQQSFFAPFYMEAKKLVESGKLGDIKQINVRFNGFARRWDWQTLQCRMAGGIYNTGPHPIGIALGLLDFDENSKVVYSKLGMALTSGDSDDYAKIIIDTPNKPVVDIEVTSVDAFSPYNIKIIGSKGTYKSTTGEYSLKYIVDGENPEKPVIFDSLKNEEGLPCYCGEKLITHEEEGKFDGTAFDIGTMLFYDMIYNKLVNDVPLTVKPEHAAKIINVIETAHAQNPLPVKFTLGGNK